MQITSYLIEAHIFRYKENSDDLEFLLLKRAESEKYPGIWQMVTGTIDKKEKAYKTALREIKEETSLVPSQFWVVPNVNSFYAHESDTICLIPVFAALVDRSEVKISAEHDEYMWASKEETKKLLAWEVQRNSVETIYNYFMEERSFLNFVEIKL